MCPLRIVIVNVLTVIKEIRANVCYLIPWQADKL